LPRFSKGLKAKRQPFLFLNKCVDSLNLSQHGRQIRGRGRDDVRLTADMLMVGEATQARVVRCVVVAEDQGSVGALVVVTVHSADNLNLNLDQFAEV